MSNQIIIPEGTQLPAHLQNRVTDNSSLAVVDSFLPRVVAKDGHFIIRKDGEDKHLPLGQGLGVVIMAASPLGKAVAKQFYASAYSPDSDAEPDCRSANGVVPDPGCLNKQSDTCAACPKNAWGSGVDAQGMPTKGKACSDRKELIIVPNTVIEGDIYMLSVSPKSLKPLSIYGRELDKHNIPVSGITTTIGFDPADPKVLKFEFGGFLDAAQDAIIQKRIQSDEVQSHVVGSDTVQPTVQAVSEPSVVAQPVQTESDVPDDPFNAPQKELHESDVDANGDEWDEQIHAATKSKTKSGLWTKRRSTQQSEAVQAAVTEPDQISDSDADELNSILGEWGA